MSDRNKEALGDDLACIVRAGLAWQTSSADGEMYAFKHALVQEVAYGSLLRSTRQGFHRRIARVLTTDFADEVELHPEVVARHLSGAGRHEEASDYWTAAGQHALARLAIPEAHGHFLRALEGLKNLPDTPEILSKELDLQIAIAPTLMTVHGWASPLVAEACERARDLCRQLGSPDKLYPPVWGLWTNLFVGACSTARSSLPTRRWRWPWRPAFPCSRSRAATPLVTPTTTVASGPKPFRTPRPESRSTRSSRSAC